MRRLVFSILAVSGLLAVGAGGTAAQAAPAPGKKVCKVEDAKLDELSGLVATRSGFVGVDDSSLQSSHKRVFFLDDRCRIARSVPFGGKGPRDTEDMVLSPDGKTLWIADTGDNKLERDTVGLWTMPADGSAEPKIHRLAYPAGDRHDAEALLLTGSGTPVIVTKDFGKPAGLYEPTGQLKTDNTTGVPLKRVGEVTIPESSTPGGALGALGRGVITGAAIAPGGGKVVLRTYADALEWDVTGGDVVAALKAKPRVTPLPDEPFGEAIAYSPDAANYYTVSDMGDLSADTPNYILKYSPAAQVLSTSTRKTAAGGAAAKASWFDNLSLTDISRLVGAVGAIGLILVGAGIVGIVRARRRAATEPLAPAAGAAGPNPPGSGAAGPSPLGPGAAGPDAATELLPAPDTPRRPAGARPGAGRPAPTVYGTPPGAAPKRGGVYGGAAAGGRPAPGAAPQPPVHPTPNGQPPARPGQGGVYGAPPAPPTARPSGRQLSAYPGSPAPVGPGGPPPGHLAGPPRGYAVEPGPGEPAGWAPAASPRPSGFFGAEAPRPDAARPPAAAAAGYAERNAGVHGRPGRGDNPGYGRTSPGGR
jgi:hypothetical protein